MINSYPKIWNIGHIAVQELFTRPVHVQEKVDGSQFSFGVFNGEPFFRSKRAQIHPGTPDKLFALAVETAMNLIEDGRLVDGWMYRGEAITAPKHNTLVYDRIPTGGIVLFDIDRGEQDYCDPVELLAFSTEIGLECVPSFYLGEVNSAEELKALMDRESFLGGPKIEGIVIKSIDLFGPDGKKLMGKIVSESFREKNRSDFAKRNPGKKDVLENLVETYRNENRWMKAVQHLRDEGKLEVSPRDIGALMAEVHADVLEEEQEEIKEALFKAFWPKIKRGITNGLPEWYKNDYLISQQKFGDE